MIGDSKVKTTGGEGGRPGTGKTFADMRAKARAGAFSPPPRHDDTARGNGATVGERRAVKDMLAEAMPSSTKIVQPPEYASGVRSERGQRY